MSVLLDIGPVTPDEFDVLQRVIARLVVIRTSPILSQSLLDEALRLELTDVRLERERADARHEAARDAMVQPEADDLPMIGAPDDRVPEQCSRCGRPETLTCCATPPRPAAVVAQPERLRRAREMAGLSLGQAIARLRPDSFLALGDTWLERFETGGRVPTDGLIRDMSSVYGVAVSWLCGADPVIAAETAALLRDADISTDYRANLTELIGAISCRDTVEMREGDASWFDGPGWYYTPDPDQGWSGAFASRQIAAQHARAAGHIADGVCGRCGGEG